MFQHKPGSALNFGLSIHLSASLLKRYECVVVGVDIEMHINVTFWRVFPICYFMGKEKSVSYASTAAILYTLSQ